MDGSLNKTNASDLLRFPPVKNEFPLFFPGGLRVRRFDGMCSACKLFIPSDQMRGKVTRPSKDVAMVAAAGVCHSCHLVTDFHFRVHADGRVSGLLNGRWQEWRLRPSLSDRLRRALSRMLRAFS